MSFLTRALPLLFCAASASPAFAKSECLTGDFSAFLARFSHEITVQEGATADPLIVDLLDPTAEPEPQLRGDEIALSDVTWPVMPDIATLEGQGLVMEISDVNTNAKAVLIRGMENGVRTTWFFTPEPCWTLVRVLDESM